MSEEHIKGDLSKLSDAATFCKQRSEGLSAKRGEENVPDRGTGLHQDFVWQVREEHQGKRTEDAIKECSTGLQNECNRNKIEKE